MTTTAETREKLARKLCELAGGDPDYLEPGDALGVDGVKPNGDKAHFFWREWLEDADAIIAAFPQLSAAPSEDVLEGARKIACFDLGCGAVDGPGAHTIRCNGVASRIATFATTHAAKEREACAKLADELATLLENCGNLAANSVDDLADEIRARQSP